MFLNGKIVKTNMIPELYGITCANTGYDEYTFIQTMFAEFGTVFYRLTF